MTSSRYTSTCWLAGIAAVASFACAHASAAPTFAVPEAQGLSAPTGVGSISAVVFGLAVVLALIFGFAWITRRVQGLQSRGASIEIIAQVSVGQKERVILVSVAGTRLLVGVASGAVTTLHTFAQNDTALDAVLSPPADTAASTVTHRFRDILQRSLGAK
jgi:flagellar protein FliO/FliZ